MRSEGGTTDPMLKTGALKMVTDGALGSRTAAIAAPYSDDPSTSGIMTIDPAKLKQMAIDRDKAGFQLNFHAIGDRANTIALDTFEAVAKANGARDRRDRVEHARIVAPADFARSRRSTSSRPCSLRIKPPTCAGPNHAWAPIRRGRLRLEHHAETEVHLAFGTDYDVEPINPMRGLYACVTRELPDGGPAGGWQPQEKISLDECIRAYTTSSAYAEFEDGKKGALVMRSIRRLHHPERRPHENPPQRIHQNQSPPHGRRRPHRLPIAMKRSPEASRQRDRCSRNTSSDRNFIGCSAGAGIPSHCILMHLIYDSGAVLFSCSVHLSFL